MTVVYRDANNVYHSTTQPCVDLLERFTIFKERKLIVENRYRENWAKDYRMMDWAENDT